MSEAATDVTVRPMDELDIGAITPDEIAVAIVAELIAHHRGRGDKLFASSMASLNKLHGNDRDVD